jgi:hypothetical protein
LPEYLKQGLLIPIKDGYEITTGLEPDSVNHILNAFKKGEKAKYAHVHLYEVLGWLYEWGFLIAFVNFLADILILY